MKKFTVLLSIILLSIFSYGHNWISISSEQATPIQQRLLYSSEESIGIQFQISGFYTNHVTTPKGKEVIISVPSMVSLAEAGAPDLPKYAVSSIIGDHALMEVVITQSEYTDFEDMDIAPSKGDFSRKIDPQTVPYTYGEMYSADTFYPALQAELQTPYILRNFRGQAVTIMPFAYNPITKILRVYHNITVELRKTGEGGDNQMVRMNDIIKEDPEFKNIYSRHFINFQASQSRYPILEEEGDLLIISYGPFMDAVQPLVDWKKTIGRPTEMVDVASLGTTPQAIKDYVTNYYNTHGLTHLLLVGDHQQVPSYNNTSSGGYSDYYYGCLAGNDSYNEVFVGRFSAENITHVQTQVQKVITYERDLDQSATWLNIGVGVARNEGAGGGHNGGESDYQHMDYIRDSLLNFTYETVYREYDGNVPGLPNTTAAQISQRINAGTTIINYCNHGSQNSWSVANYSSSHVNALTNTDRWPIVWPVACDNGRFTSGDCFAEAWMRATHNGQPAGAIGTMMSWISQPWQAPMTGQDEMVTILVEGYGNNIKRTLGGTSINGSMKMIDLHGSSGRSTHDTWILFGDPTLTLRTAPPEPIAVNHLPAIFLGMNELTVDADAEDAIVSLTIDGEIIGTGMIQDGSTTISFPPLNNVGVLKIAVFGFNKVTYIEEIEIIPASGPFVAYLSNMVNGAEGGQVHYGTDVTLGVQLKNLGVEPASNVLVTLTTDSPYVTITNGTANYETIQPDQIVLIEDAFAFTLSDEVPNNTKLPFELTITADEDNWESSFNLTALAPAFTIGTYSVSDPTGNGNGRLDPGETADIIVQFANEGMSQAMDAVAEIVFDNPYITINSASFEVGDIAAGSSATASFNITVSGNAPIGQAAEFLFSLQAGAYTAEKSFVTKIGLILDDFETGNFSAFPYTFGGNQPWNITLMGAYEGTYCAKSGNITHSQSSQLILEYEASANDSFSFYRKVSSESGYDFLRFYIDNVKVGEWAGTIGWDRVAYPVAQGNHTFKWEYVKDFMVSSGDDCAWIDYIVFPPALVTTGWAGNNAAICAGESYQLDGSATNYNSFVCTTSGSGTFSNPNILNPIYTPSEADISDKSVELTLSVHGSSTTVESSLTLNINPMPEVFAGNNIETCPEMEIELNQATATDYISLTWFSTGSGEFSDPANLQTTYFPSEEDYVAGTVILTLEAEGIGSCGNSSSELEVHFLDKPTAALSGNQQLCEGTAAELTVELTGLAPWTIVLADDQGSFDIPATPYSIQLYPQENITYSIVEVTDANGCVNSGNGQAVVELIDIPIQTMIVSAPDTVDFAYTISSEITVEEVAFATSYSYMIEPETAATISGEGSTAILSWNSEFTGEVKVYAAAVNECGQSDWSEPATIFVINTVGVMEQQSLSLNLYPNPSTGVIFMELNQLRSPELQITVINNTGIKVYEEQSIAIGKQYRGTLQLDQLPKGIYLLRIENGKTTITKRIAIHR